MRYPSENTTRRLKAISDEIENEVERLGSIGSVDLLREAVRKVIPDARESEFRVALRRLHLFTSG
jgi:hypothetical protein